MTRSQEGASSLRQFDLNLLPILRALLATHSVSRASELVGLSPSATSGALTRLRLTFGDPLLVQVGRNLTPTPRAIELKPYVDAAFHHLFDLFDQRDFLAEKEERHFVISTSDYVVGELSIPLLEAMTKQAPGASVRFVEVSPPHLANLESGDIDFMVTPLMGSAPPPEVQALPLSSDEMVIVSSDHFPMPAGGLDLDTYLASHHAAYGVSGSETFEQRAVAAQGLGKRDLITVPQFHLLPEFVQRIDCLAMMPRHVAERARGPFRLCIWPVPFEMPKLEFQLYWSLVLDRSPPHIWFRELIATAWRDAQRGAAQGVERRS